MKVIIKYRARAKYAISYLTFNNPIRFLYIRKKTIFDEFLYGRYKYIIHERTKYEGDKVFEGFRVITHHHRYTKVIYIYISLLVLNVRKSYKSRVFQREEPKACATSRKVLGLGKIFPLPSSTTSGHPIFRRLVR